MWTGSWGDRRAGKVLVLHAEGPEFRAPTPPFSFKIQMWWDRSVTSALEATSGLHVHLHKQACTLTHTWIHTQARGKPQFTEAGLTRGPMTWSHWVPDSHVKSEYRNNRHYRKHLAKSVWILISWSRVLCCNKLSKTCWQPPTWHNLHPMYEERLPSLPVLSSFISVMNRFSWMVGLVGSPGDTLMTRQPLSELL